ncbi:MAG: SMP-30/gluconolactonase/LRE family protein [Planctomycetota bacterium]
MAGRRVWIGMAVLLLTSSVPIRGAEDPILPDGEAFELLTMDVDFAEGPAAGPDGAIYFSDIPTGEKPGRILRFEPAGNKISIFRSDSHKSNGLFFDSLGRLVACEGADFGGRAIRRYNTLSPTAGEGEVILADQFEGKKFNAPNDLCVDQLGRVWFTDPKYLGAEERELTHRSVYRIDPDGSLKLAITQPVIEKPNGIHVSPDGKTLYVADTSNEPVKLPDGTERPGNQQLVAFSISADGTPAEKKVLVDYSPGSGVDGMTVDTQGNIYAAVRDKEKPGVRIYAPDGKQIGFIPTHDVPTNCVFGKGPEANRLYITTDTGFGRIRLNATGYHLPDNPPKG